MVDMKSVLELIFMLLTSASFAVLFKTPRRYFFHVVGIGVIAGTSSRFFSQLPDPIYSTFFVAAVVAILSHLLAKRTGSPAQVFLTPGIIILVPGIKLYQSFSAAMADDITKAMQFLLYAVGITCAISFAILLANWIVPSRKEL
jgi:uncharacterized membrane protein YjjB (DUF3815 family)